MSIIMPPRPERSTSADSSWVSAMFLYAESVRIPQPVHMSDAIRRIAEARRDNRPAYIAGPSDYALAPVVPADVKPIELRSNEAALQKATIRPK